MKIKWNTGTNNLNLIIAFPLSLLFITRRVAGLRMAAGQPATD
jgi:hypothetical protein